MYTQFVLLSIPLSKFEYIINWLKPFVSFKWS